MQKTLPRILTALSLVLMLTQLFLVATAQGGAGNYLYTVKAPYSIPDAVGVAVDKDDNLYVTTTDSVQIYSSSGALIRKWGSYGSGDGQFSYPNAIALDGSGKVYVADTGNSRIQVFDSSGAFLYKWADAKYPAAIATHGTKVYVLGKSSVRIYDDKGTLLKELGGDALVNAVDMIVSDDGLLYVLYCGYDLITIKVLAGTEVRNSYSFGGYSGSIGADSAGNIYVAADVMPGGFITVFDRNLKQIKWLGWYERLGWGYDISVDSKGNIFVSGDWLRVYDSSGSAVNSIQAMAVDKTGELHVVEGHGKVEVFGGNGQVLRQWTGNFCQPNAAVFDGSGNFQLIDGAHSYEPPECKPTSLARVFDSSGNFLRSWGEPNQMARGVAIDKNGNFLVSDSENNTIRVYDKDGNVVTSFGGRGVGDGQFASPAGIAVDENGSIFVADNYNYRIQVFDDTYKFIRKWGSHGDGDGQFYLPEGIAVDATGHVFVSDMQYVQVFDAFGNFLLKWRYGQPGGLVVDQSGRVYVGDGQRNQIPVFEGFGPGYSISGTVREGSATGPVLPGATVSIAGKSATTSSTGTFSITGVPGGSHTLTISMNGYATRTVTGYLVSGDQSGIDFYLAQTLYSMSGTVRQGSATGSILPGATVAIAGKTATTSNTGAFSITGIPAGTYTLTVSKSGYATKTVPGCVVNRNISGAIFYLSAGYAMSGTVRHGSATGPVLGGARIAIAGKTATTSSTGAFTITGIPAGTYTLTVSRTGYVTKTVSGCVVNSNKSGLVFFLSPAYTISGTVRLGSASGPVLAGAKVALAGKSAITSSTGTFTITGVPAGTYTLTISRTGYVIKTVTGFVVNSNKSGLVFFLARASAGRHAGVVALSQVGDEPMSTGEFVTEAGTFPVVDGGGGVPAT